MRFLLRAIVDAFEELEMCDGLIFACKCPGTCTWAHWPEETVRIWWQHGIVKQDVVESTDLNHIRCRIDVGQLVFCGIMTCFNVLKSRVDLYEELPRLVWRIIEMGKKDVRIRDFMRRDSSRYTVMRWFADWVDGPFPPETRNIVLDQWAASLLHTKMLALKEKRDGAAQGNTGHDARDS